MTLPLTGLRVALAEGRQLEELAALLEKEGAMPLRYPMLNILDAPDPVPVELWLRDAINGRFDWLILLTGEGLRRLIGFADRAGMKNPFVERLATTPILTRGPKPVLALKELGLKPTRVAAAPTTDGVIASLEGEPLAGKTVAVQLYNEANPPLQDFLVRAGATVRSVQPYIYAPASDTDRVVELIRNVENGSVEMIVFTSSPQIDRLYEVAAERNLADVWDRGIRSVKIASVGPVVTENLRTRGLTPFVQPAQGFQMKNLVVQIRRSLTPGQPAAE
jgi:uroporphyrinogen-III synthase